MYKMQVALSDATETLNVRNAPSKKGERIARLNHDTIVMVQAEAGKWKFVTYDGGSGYVSANYLIPYEETEIVRNNASGIVPNDTVNSNNASGYSNNTDAYSNNTKITIVDSAGNYFEPVGDYRVLRGSVD